MLKALSEKGQGCIEIIAIIAFIAFVGILVYNIVIVGNICTTCHPITFPKGY